MKTTKTDTIAKRNIFMGAPIINPFSWVRALLLLTGVIFFAILPNAWPQEKPKVSSLNFTSTGPYKVENSITVEVGFDKRIKVSGTPQLTLIIGTTERQANLAG